MRILIVEDDKDLASTLSNILVKKGFETMVCYNFIQAYNEIEKNYDCFLLDQILPDGNGFQLLSMIREKNPAPVLMISSDKNEDSILKGYDLKADDYIEKPFRLSVFLAKLESVLRRSGKLDKEISVEEYCLSIYTKELFFHEERIILTITECSILESLFQAYPNVVSRQQIIQNIYAKTYKETSSQTLNVRLSELRRKLKEHSYHIENIPRSGLRWRT